MGTHLIEKVGKKKKSLYSRTDLKAAEKRVKLCSGKKNTKTNPEKNRAEGLTHVFN